MITATLSKDQLEFLYKFLKPVTDEVYITMGKDGWKSISVDNAHVAMVRFELIPANFTEYSYDKDEEFMVGLKVDKLRDWYDALKAGHVTKAIFERSNGEGTYSWAAQIDGLLQRKGATLDPAGDPKPKWPKMTSYDTPMFTLSEAQAGELKTMLVKNPEYSQFLIQYGPDGLKMGLAKDLEIIKKIAIRPAQLKEHGSKELEATSVNADYLRGIFKAVAGRPSNKDALRFTFKSESPLQIEFVKDNIREAIYLLAPKLDDEDTKAHVISTLAKEPKVQVEKESHTMPHYVQAGALKKGRGKKATTPYSEYINEVMTPLLEDEVPLSQIIDNTERVLVEWKIDENGEAFDEKEVGAREPLTLQQFRKDFDQLSVKPEEVEKALDALEQDIKIEAKIAPEVKKFGEEVEKAMQHPPVDLSGLPARVEKDLATRLGVVARTGQNIYYFYVPKGRYKYLGEVIMESELPKYIKMADEKNGRIFVVPARNSKEARSLINTLKAVQYGEVRENPLEEIEKGILATQDVRVQTDRFNAQLPFLHQRGKILAETQWHNFADRIYKDVAKGDFDYDRAVMAIANYLKVQADSMAEVRAKEEVEMKSEEAAEEFLAKQEANMVLEHYARHQEYPVNISERAWTFLKKHYAELQPEEEKAWTKAIEFYINAGMTDDDAGQKAWEDVQEQFPRLRTFSGALPHIEGELEEGKFPMSEIELVQKLRPFLPAVQFHLIAEQLKGEEGEYFQKLFEKMIFDWEEMPTTYQTEKVPKDQKIVRMHYFTPSSDWYIIEKDKELEQDQAFGYVILNGDTENAELGYISIEELKKIPSINLDYNWKPTPLGKVIEGKEAPDRTTKPGDYETIKKVIQKRFTGSKILVLSTLSQLVADGYDIDDDKLLAYFKRMEQDGTMKKEGDSWRVLEKPKRGRPKKGAKKPEPVGGEDNGLVDRDALGPATMYAKKPPVGKKMSTREKESKPEAKGYFMYIIEGKEYEIEYTVKINLEPDEERMPEHVEISSDMPELLFKEYHDEIEEIALEKGYEQYWKEHGKGQLEVPLPPPTVAPSKFTKLNLTETQVEAISKYAEYNWYLLREAIEHGYDELAKQVVGDMSYNPCFRNLVRSDILQEKDRNRRMEKVEVAIDKWTDSVFTDLKKRIDVLPGSKGKCDIRMGPGTVLELKKVMNPEYGIFVTGGTVSTAAGLYKVLSAYGLQGVIKPGPGDLIVMEAKRVGDFCPGELKQVQDDKGRASKAIDSARNMIMEAEAQKAEVTGARETLHAAQRSMARLDYDAAVDFAQKAEKEASGAITRAEAPKKAPAPVAPPQAPESGQMEAYGNFEVRKTSRPAGAFKVWDTAQNDWSHGIPSDVDGPVLGNAPTYDIDEANIRAKMLAQWHEEKYAKDEQMRIIMEPTGQKVGGYMVYRFKRYEIANVPEQFLQPPAEYGMLSGEKKKVLVQPPRQATTILQKEAARPSPTPPKQVVAFAPPPKPIPPPAQKPTMAVIFQSGNFQVKQIGKYMVIDSLTQKTMAIESDLEEAKAKARGFAEDRNRQFETDAKFKAIVSKVGTTDDGMTIYKYGR